LIIDVVNEDINDMQGRVAKTKSWGYCSYGETRFDLRSL